MQIFTGGKKYFSKIALTLLLSHTHCTHIGHKEQAKSTFLLLWSYWGVLIFYLGLVAIRGHAIKKSKIRIILKCQMAI